MNAFGEWFVKALRLPPHRETVQELRRLVNDEDRQLLYRRPNGECWVKPGKPS